MRLFCVAPQFIDKVWPHAKAFIDQALVRSQSDYTLDHIQRKLKENKSLLWIVFNHEAKRIEAALTTEICGVLDTDRRVCVFTTFGANSFELARKYLADIEQYARKEKCELIRAYGRRGWIRALREDGYEQPWIAIEKRLV